ncbi:SUKH-4 family immunity protein [Streptomyces sp. NPDC059524]|uniref:SUKH-4 family immunity protein n=1 Tax=Streptomyces sp. NPDC059524 TaxID=3346856 RepID=UPI0036AB496D
MSLREVCPRVAGMDVLGDLLVEGQTAHHIVRDPETGRVYATESYDPPDEMYPLAPSAEALRRMSAAVSDLDALRGPFSGLRGQFGLGAVKEAARLLSSAFTGEDWGSDGWGLAEEGPEEWVHGLPPVWRIQACVKPLALIAGPGRGLRMDLAADVLTNIFGADGVRRFTPGELPEALTHAPTRRFLTEVGLPSDVPLFYPTGSEDDPLCTVAEHRAAVARDPQMRRHFEDGASHPVIPDADRFVLLGGTPQDVDVVVDGRTGEVHWTSFLGDDLTAMNADISTLVFALWMYGTVEALEKPYALKGDDTDSHYHFLADTMVGVLESVDPVACLPETGPEDYRYWPEVWHDEAGGVL